MRPSSARALLALSTLVLVSLGGSAAAQEQGPASEPGPAPARGKRALLFEIKTFEGGGFQLQEFEGLLISFKRHWSERNAFRVGLDLDASIADTDRAATSADSLTSQTSKMEESQDRESLALVGQYLGHTGLAGGVRAY